ncbi:MAG: type II toxin-antitoxin system RelE/ParE family toxin [Planctomycetes bacterium]|nr:type II toxin-antitoxin system RelE/ParE family toxin [Planctomycetota bacterium]
MRRTFIELPAFSRLVRDGRISDRALKALQNDIMVRGGAVIPGTGGLVKIRSAGSGRGKSGGVRAIYADYPAQGMTVLIAAYFKNMKVNLTEHEKWALRSLKMRLDGQIGV